jgi:hypothetical protein
MVLSNSHFITTKFNVTGKWRRLNHRTKFLVLMTFTKVLKGAVFFGHKPDYIASRVMRFSYETDVITLFDPDKHEQDRTYTCKFTDNIRNDLMTSASTLILSPRSSILLANGED